ncbi:MAG: immunoglobulin domain-containing protein [Opitutales bacterium]|jgi:hypothetical protein
MTLNIFGQHSKHGIRHLTHGRLTRRWFLSLGLVPGLAVSALGWTTLPLPNLVSAPPHYGALAITHLPDGRFLYGNNNLIYTQNAFGAANVSAFATIGGDGVDPSFLAVLSSRVAVVGAGMAENSSLYQFNPLSAVAPKYASIVTTQNFSGVARNAASLYVAGEDGTDGVNAVSVVTLTGAEQLLVDQAGEFSAGLATDGAGDLFVADNDNDAVYEFTPRQLQKALAEKKTLTPADGQLIYTFSTDVVDSIVEDARGRLWAAGFASDGMFWWDPAQKLGGVLTPQVSGGAYTMSTFLRNGTGYVSYAWQAGFSTGDAVVYGYATAADALAPVITQQPEPVTASRGQTVHFSVSATSPSPLTQTYAWQKNGAMLRNAGRISGANTATLTVSGVTIADGGSYRVVITNAEGKATSLMALLKIQ